MWGGSHLDDTHYLRIVVRNLRKKIEFDPVRPRILSGSATALDRSGAGIYPAQRLAVRAATYGKFTPTLSKDTRGLTRSLPSFSPLLNASH